MLGCGGDERMRTERRMGWASVLGLSVAVAMATVLYSVALLVRDDPDEDVDVDADAFEGDNFSEFD